MMKELSMYQITKDFNDLFLGTGKFFYSGYKRKNNTWRTDYGYPYRTKSAAQRALKSLNDPSAKIESI